MVFIISSKCNLLATPLQYAIKSESCTYEGIKYLIDHGANVQECDYMGETPLHYLYQSHSRYSKDIALLLLDSGVEINKVDLRGYNVLHYAVQTVFKTDIIELLLDRGASINALDMSDNSPLHFALKMNSSYAVIKMLIDRGADIHQLNQRDIQALHMSVCRHNLKFIKLMLERGANLNVPDCENRSPLLISMYSNRRDIVKTLLDSGALLSCGKSPMEHAISRNYSNHEERSENVQFLLKYALLENEMLGTDDPYCGSELPAEFYGYREDCLHEIRTMKLVPAARHSNLAKYVFQMREDIKSKRKANAYRICDKLLHIVYTNAYPLYSEVISGLLKREYLIHKLERLMAAASYHPDPFSDEENSGMLHAYALGFLVKYVHESDILKVVLAFYSTQV